MYKFFMVLIVLCMGIVLKAQKPLEVTIAGNIKNLPVKKMYLVDAFHWQFHLDSTVITRGGFVLHHLFKNGEPPFEASIIAPADSGMISFRLAYHNPVDTVKGFKGFTSFMLVPGENIRFTGKFKSIMYGATNRLNIHAGPQNDIFFKYFTPTGNPIFTLSENIALIKSPRRDSLVRDAQAIIKKNPKSYFLLEMINEQKPRLSNEELSKFLSAFDSSMASCRYYTDIQDFVSERASPAATLVNIPVENTEGNKAKILDTSAKISVLVFWASWCGPCRREIPELKELYNEYKNNPEVSMRSISIDDDKNAWKTALKEENMAWQQYVVSDRESLSMVQAASASFYVPTILFVDKHGNQLGRFIGAATLEDYEKIINEAIKE